MGNIHILLCEDDTSLGYVIKDSLEEAGYVVTHCPDGHQGWQAFKEHRYDLCIFDVMMPRKDGFTLAAEVRKVNAVVPIIFLTAKSMKEDKHKGFEQGGDDYITKPFEMQELLFRIQVFLKRTAQPESDEQYHIASFHLDFNNLELRREGEVVKKLTLKEGEVLRLLCLNVNNIIKREDILVKIWGSNDYFMGRSLDVFITKIRKYLKDDPRLEIQNHHGVGFKLHIEEGDNAELSTAPPAE